MDTEYEYGLRNNGIIFADKMTWERADEMLRWTERIDLPGDWEIVKRPIGEWTVCS